MFSKRSMTGPLTILTAGWMVITQVPSGHVRAASPQAQGSSGAAASSSQRALLDTYCVTCHNQKLRTAGLTLDTVDVAKAGGDAEVWEKVIRKLRMGAMPPPGRPRPDKPITDAFRSWLESEIDGAAALNPNPGRVETFHRINRAEYKNAIRDLLALDIDIAPLLPADDTDRHGFDNTANVLSVSPTLLERYLSTARSLSRLAVGLAPPSSGSDTYKSQVLALQDDQVNASEDLPFGSRGGIAIHHQFPVDGEYLISVRLRRTGYDYIIGLGEPHQLEVRLDGVRVTSFTVGGQGKGKPAPLSFSGNVPGDPEWEEYALRSDAGLQVRLPAKAGPRVVAVSFVARPTVPEGVQQRPEFVTTNSLSYDNPYGNPAVESVRIDGPLEVAGTSDTPSRRKIFSCRPASAKDEDPCARKILSLLARRAYRRPVTEGEVNTLIGFYRSGRSEGSFDAGIRLALERLLADPNFLFRVERDPAHIAPGTVYRISDLELASRLSFFLWSSIPDDELLDLAIRRKLKEPAVLAQQVRRMFADPRSKALVDNFVGQWLQLRNIAGVTPNQRQFPDFDETLRKSFRRETELFVESTMREDRSVIELLSANYTFVNERLARHYQIPNIYGEHFRRVTFGDDARGGLLGQGSLLTVTSYPTRTSPVLRGKWLLENILGTPPPPPPANVPGLPDLGQEGKPASVRERLEQHRRNPVCAGCHSQMDPLGFALENFDAVGKWRTTTEAGTPVDASGAFPSGAQFEGPAGLRTFLLSNREPFVDTVIAKLFSYALGRELEYYDFPSVRKIARNAASSDYRWSSIILGIVTSPAFGTKRSGPEEPKLSVSTGDARR